jgi:hypothetical protein
MTRSEDALLRLYEDTGWREDLIDSEANQLLKWAEAKLHQFDAQAQADPAASETDFERKVDDMRRVLTKINKFVGRRMNLSLEEQQTTLDEMAALSKVEPVAADDLTLRSFSAQSGDANTALLNTLTSWLDGNELTSFLSGFTATDAETDENAETMRGGITTTPNEPEPPPAAPMPATDMSAFLNFFNAAPAPTPPEDTTHDEDESTTHSDTDAENSAASDEDSNSDLEEFFDGE